MSGGGVNPRVCWGLDCCVIFKTLAIAEQVHDDVAVGGELITTAIEKENKPCAFTLEGRRSRRGKGAFQTSQIQPRKEGVNAKH